MLDLIQSFIDFIFRVVPRPPLTPDQIKGIKIVAHRGCHETGFVENTLPAFTWCVEHNIWGIEFDIHFTSDNKPIVHHDEHCGRLFDRPDLIIVETTFSDLRKQIPEIPTLEEVLDLCSEKIHLMIEIKTILTTEQNQILNDLLTSLTPKEDYHIISLKTECLDSVSFVSSDCFVPVSELNVKKLMNYAIENNCAGLAGHYVLVTSSRKKKLSENNISTGVGYISSKNSLARAIGRNHDWIFTNHPNHLLTIIEKYS